MFQELNSSKKIGRNERKVNGIYFKRKIEKGSPKNDQNVSEFDSMHFIQSTHNESQF